MPRPEDLAELERQVRARFVESAASLRSNLEARLREASEALFSAVAEARVEPPAALFEPATLDALDEEARRGGERAALDALVESALAFDRAATQGAVLEALLAGARRFAPRAALLLTRESGWLGWGAAGFAADADPIAGREGDYSGAALAELARGRGAVAAGDQEAAELAAALGLPGARAARLVPLVLRDRVAAALYVDRREGEPEPPAAAFALLVSAAAARLELQPLVRRDATPTLVDAPSAAAVGLPLWSESATAAAEAVPAPDEPAAEGELDWTAVEAEDAQPAAVPPAEPSEPSESIESIEPAEPIELAAEQELFALESDELAPASEPEAGVESGAGLVPVEEEAPLMPGEPVFELADDVEAPVLELAPEVAAPAEELPEESEWQAEEGEATAFLGAVPAPASTPPPPPPETEPGESTAPLPPLPPGEPGDLSATRAIAADAWQPPVPPPPAPAPSPASTLAFAPPAVPVDERPYDPTEDATLMISRATAPATPPAPAPPAEEDPNERTAARAPRTTEVAPPPDVRGPGLAFSSARGGRATGDNALHEEARRLARLLISEIKLYNEEQVDEGRRNRDLYHRLKDDIDRSRQIYEERVHESVREATDYFQQELVRSLAGGDPRALGV